MAVVKPTRDEIDEQGNFLTPDGHLTPEDQADAIDVVTQEKWDDALTPTLERAVAAAAGYQAKRVRAAIQKIDKLGQKDVQLNVGKGLIRRSRAAERKDWVAYIVSVLRVVRSSGAGGASTPLRDLGGRHKLCQ